MKKPPIIKRAETRWIVQMGTTVHTVGKSLLEDIHVVATNAIGCTHKKWWKCAENEKKKKFKVHFSNFYIPAQSLRKVIVIVSFRTLKLVNSSIGKVLGESVPDAVWRSDNHLIWSILRPLVDVQTVHWYIGWMHVVSGIKLWVFFKKCHQYLSEKRMVFIIILTKLMNNHSNIMRPMWAYVIKCSAAYSNCLLTCSKP